MAEPLGYIVVRDEDDQAEGTHEVVADWDGGIHTTWDAARAELAEAKREEPLYDWYIAEVCDTGGDQ